MSKTIHNIYLFILTLIVVVVFILLMIKGLNYYSTSFSERFYHEQHGMLKPSGFWGHGLGIIGSGLLLFGVFGYMARKRMRIFSRIGYLRYWLEFHIFLCSLGPVLILYHTAFKFGGIVAISFWSMAAVVVSGIIGRFIYLQIPRTIEGHEMSMNEISEHKSDLRSKLSETFGLKNETLEKITITINQENSQKSGNEFVQFLDSFKQEKIILKQIKLELKSQNISKKSQRKIIVLIKKELVLQRRIKWLISMQNLLRYWHVAHLPFALIMLVIMIVHVIIAVTFGYKWIL